MLENVEKCVKMWRNGWERERGSKPYLTCQIFKKTIDRFSRASRKRFKLWWTDRKCGMGVFRTKSVTENVEHYRETGVREGEAQNTTFLNVSFRVSSVPDFLDDGSRQFRMIRFVKEVNAGFCGWNFGYFFVVYRQFRIFCTTDLGNSGYLDLHSEPVQREGEAQRY